MSFKVQVVLPDTLRGVLESSPTPVSELMRAALVEYLCLDRLTHKPLDTSIVRTMERRPVEPSPKVAPPAPVIAAPKPAPVPQAVHPDVLTDERMAELEAEGVDFEDDEDE